jgi:SSS family solute:Na+ symporter
MHPLDYLVLVGYFLLMSGIGFWAMRRIKVQEDYFMGGRGFGKLLQTFAAFGAGTGSADPVNTARTTFTGGASGMWSVMYWLFVTPFYWITGVWYRRMRHTTIGDWFVERYESPRLGAAYALFAILWQMVYGSMLFSAIGKVAAPLMGIDEVMIGGQAIGLEYILVPIFGLVVLGYGIAGGLTAAYWTDLVQGLCIILLSVLLVPFGLGELVRKFGDSATEGIGAGFRILHEQLPPEKFDLLGGAGTEFTLPFLVSVVALNLIGIVVQPHFIVTGGGSAKTETDARVGLVVGNFLKRFCTIGWLLTALIALALYANDPVLATDPDKTWGLASQRLLGPGLTGLMLACLLAALMSSVDAYMVVGSALFVRNIYSPFFNPHAGEREYIRLARIMGVVIVGGSVVFSLSMMDVFKQLQLTWVVLILFAAPFWIGMYWRRATTAAAWATALFGLIVFFALPRILPILSPGMRTDPRWTGVSNFVETTTQRSASPADVAQRKAQIAAWETAHAHAKDNAQRPHPLALGEIFQERRRTGGKALYWSEKVVPVDDQGQPDPAVVPRPVGSNVDGQGADGLGAPGQGGVDGKITHTILQFPAQTARLASGSFHIDFLVYDWLGIDLQSKSADELGAMALALKCILPFIVMIGVSLITPRNNKNVLDRYYAKMKTPVLPDREEDRWNLEEVLANPAQTESLKLFPGTSLEFNKPTRVDVLGFLACTGACFGIIGLALWVVQIGG